MSPAIELSDDLAHLIAYPIGFMSAYLFETKNKALIQWRKTSEKSIAQKLSIKPGSKFLVGKRTQRLYHPDGRAAGGGYAAT